jgi:hypothetical protein
MMHILICPWGTQCSENTKRLHFLKLPLQLASSIPQKYFIFVSTIIFSILLILALQYVTRVEAKAILGRPVTNLGTRCITFIPSSREMFYFWPISVCTTTSYVGTTGQNCVTQTHRYCIKTEIIKGFTNKINNIKLNLLRSFFFKPANRQRQ